MAIAINQAKAIRQSYQLVTVSSCSEPYRWIAVSLRRKGPPPKPGNCQKSFSFRWSRGSDLRLLRLTMNGLPDRTSGERPRASSIVRVRRLDLMKLGPFAGKIRTDRCGGHLPAATPVLSQGACNSGRLSVQQAARLGNQLSFAGWRPNLRGHR